jgi:hypothetical protein
MTNSNTQRTQSEPNTKTEAELKSVDGQAGQGNQSSHDAKSHSKAGSDQGAGGGKKQERHH